MGSDAPAGFNFVCPCGCGHIGAANFQPPDVSGWTWDGNRAQPTVSPSLNFDQGRSGAWHGFLRNGVFEEC